MWTSVLALALEPEPVRSSPASGSLVLFGVFVGFVLGRLVFGRKATYQAGLKAGKAEATAEADATATARQTVQVWAGNTVDLDDPRSVDAHIDRRIAAFLNYDGDPHHVGAGDDLYLGPGHVEYDRADVDHDRSRDHAVARGARVARRVSAGGRPRSAPAVLGAHDGGGVGEGRAGTSEVER